MATIRTQTFSITIPPIFGLQTEQIAYIRASSNEVAYNDQPPLVTIMLTSKEVFDDYQGANLKERFYTACLENNYKAEELSQTENTINDCPCYILHAKTDAKWQSRHFKIQYFFAAIVVDEGYVFQFIGLYETQAAEQFQPIIQEVFDSLNWWGATDDRHQQIFHHEQQVKATYQKELSKSSEPPIPDFPSFQIPTDGKDVFIIGKLKFDYQEATSVHIEKNTGRRFNGTLQVQLPNYDKKRHEKFLNEWDEGSVQLSILTQGIYHPDAPKGKGQVLRGKNQTQAFYLSASGLSSYWKWSVEIILQDGWLGVLGYLEKGYDHSDKKYIPVEIYKKIPVAKLDWSHYKFTTLAELAAAPKEVVQHISLLQNFEQFPKALLVFQNIKTFHLIGHFDANKEVRMRISKLPDEFYQFRKLEYLHLANIRLTQISEKIIQLQQLNHLVITNSDIATTPKGLWQLRALKFLTLSKNKIKKLPSFIDLPNLTWINLEANQLKSLPELLAKQPSLTTLKLEKNPLIQLPAAFNIIKDIELAIEDKKRLLDYDYKGADCKGLIAWDDKIYWARYDDKLITSVENIIKNNDLSDYKIPLLATLKRAVGFLHTSAGDYQVIGNHRFGGFPDLPKDIEYPRFGENWRVGKKDYVYEFIAQINCSSIAHLQEYLPRTGMLYFFLQSIHEIYNDQQAAKVIYFDGEVSQLQNGEVFDFDEGDFDEVTSIPPYKPWQVEAKVMNSVPGFYAARNNQHWFLGDAMPLKKGMEDDSLGDRLYNNFEEPVAFLEKYEYAINSYMFTQHESPELQAALQQKGNAEDWMILLKVTSSGDFQWGDAGDLAFVIHKSDLAKRDFSNVFCTVESS